MNCWAFLDLPDHADERTIRRRYAQLLRVHRPDEDPEAFQRLRDAYEQALDIARWRAEQAAEDDDEASLDAESPASGLHLQALWEPTGERPELDFAFPVVPQQPEPESLPAHWFASAEPAALQATLTEAIAAGRRDAFETTLLQRCLDCTPEALAMTRWALQNLHWFDLAQQTELPLRALDALAHRLIDAAIEELAEDLHAGRERMFVECLKMLLGSAWLQSFDRRTLFRQRLAGLLLAAPYWSDALFGVVCELCGWSEQNFHDDWQWRVLLSRAEQAAYAQRLQGFVHLDEAVTSEQRAAWLLLKPMGESERERFKRSLANDDWASYELLYEKLRYRFPDLWESWGRKEQEMQPAAFYSNGWAYSDFALYLLIFAMLAIGAGVRGRLEAEPAGEGLILLLPLALLGAMMTWVVGWLGGLWSGLARLASGVDGWLSEKLLLDDWVDGREGLLVLRHLVPSALLGWAMAAMSGLAGEKMYMLGLLTFVSCSAYALLAVRGWSVVGEAVGLVRGAVDWLLSGFKLRS